MALKDRKTKTKERQNPSFPNPPLNANVQWSFSSGEDAVDLYWEDPSLLPNNNDYDILGVNVYRAFDSEYGPYHRLNDNPIGALFYRDQTTLLNVEEEDVSGRFLSANDETGEWTFRTQNYPIHKPSDPKTYANSSMDVVVYIDGKQVRPARVIGETGEVVLQTKPTYNAATNERIDAVLPRPDSEVTCSYSYRVNNVDHGLYKRVFYRVTTVGYSSWDGLLKETPLNWTEALHIHQMENLDYIWEEAIRRNRWILDQGGERVKVFIHKNRGIPCGCHRRYSDPHPYNDCHTCFPPGTLVRAERGYVPIEEIRIGEKVLTQDGTFREVLATMKNPFSGDLVELRSSVSASKILTTPSHPFLTLDGFHDGREGRCGPGENCTKYIRNGDGLSGSYDINKVPSGKYWARCQMRSVRGGDRRALGTHPTKEEARAAIDSYRNLYQPGHTLIWKGAGELEDEDWLVSKWPFLEESLDVLEVPDAYVGSPGRRGPKSYQVTSEFLWVVGLYLAEGSAGTRSIHFSLHRKETEFQERLFKFFSEMGFDPKLYTTSDNGVDVTIHSSTLAEWWPVWLGKSCYEKAIPEELMRLPPKQQQYILNGIYDGDGWKNGLEVTQTSEILALQISEILHRLGKQPLLRQQHSYIPIEGTGNMRATAYTVSWEADDFHHTNRKGRWAFRSGESEGLLARVSEVDRVSYDGPVYNLTVEGNHTYVVQGVVVHNCFGTGIRGGYEGPYEVLMAPPDSERRISQSERGRDDELTYDVWTGPRPLLSHRDFFVKLNGERYSIGGVRMPTNRGNVLQQHFSVNLLEDNDIRYKVPVVGTDSLAFPETRIMAWDDDPDLVRYPQVTGTKSSPEGIQERGRTPVWENISGGS